jgi:excisionase family DNA binding protein
MQDPSEVQVTPAVLTPEQAAVYLNTSERHILSMVRTRTIPYTMVGKRRRFRKVDLDLWIERNVKGAHA